MERHRPGVGVRRGVIGKRFECSERSGNCFRLCGLGSGESCALVWGCQEKARRIRSTERGMSASGMGRKWSLLPTCSQRIATVKTEWLMGAMVVRRSRKAGSLVCLVFGFAMASAAEPTPVQGGLGSRHIDPAQVLPSIRFRASTARASLR